MSRPLLHHTPAAGWINDPYGLTWHDGRYHLFFQYVPGRTTWDVGCQWGHATSTDLLTWEPQPVALAPGDGDDGCWSGSVAGGAVFYTSVSADDPSLGRVRRAVPTDDGWSTWTKSGVVVEAPPGATHFRDPFVRRDSDGWQMILGCATADGPAVWSYRSDDLERWLPDGVVASRPGTEWTGQGWECPSLLEVDGRTVLLVSVWEPDTLHFLAYAVCSPDATGLHPGSFQRLSYGPSYYAASAFADRDGRPGLVGWLREVADPEAGWAGATSLPATVRLDGDRLVVTPHDALLARRGDTVRGLLPTAADVVWTPAPGDELTAAAFSLSARDRSVLLTAGQHEVELPWAGEPLRAVVDGPVLELYGGLGIAAVPLVPAGAGPLTWTGAEPVVFPLGQTDGAAAVSP